MILVRSEAGEEYMNAAVEAGVLELRPAEEMPSALDVMYRLSRKQRERIKPDDPHANHRWPTQQAIEAAKAADAEAAT